jgi:hypothetical protein
LIKDLDADAKTVIDFLYPYDFTLTAELELPAWGLQVDPEVNQ